MCLQKENLATKKTAFEIEKKDDGNSTRTAILRARAAPRGVGVAVVRSCATPQAILLCPSNEANPRHYSLNTPPEL